VKGRPQVAHIFWGSSDFFIVIYHSEEPPGVGFVVM
jgi:hypothetical protein